MENPSNPLEEIDSRLEWETPELTVEIVAAATQLNLGASNDGLSGS